MRDHDERALRSLLHQQADRHRPDRDAMFDRIIQNRAEPARRPALIRLRPLAAAFGVVAVLVGGVAGVRLASSDGDDNGTDQVAAPTASVSPSPSGSPSVSASPSGSPSASSRKPQVSTSSGASHRATTKDGYLSSQSVLDPGSNPSWTQNDVVLTTTKTITELDVTITVAKTDKVEYAGRWTSVPENMMTITPTQQADTIVYRFVLLPGGQLAPGSYTFAAQYNHPAAKHALGGDKYEVKAKASKTSAKVAGGFK
ncbi:hypothetical protein GCM10010435_91350 [Winogradskya consettensis]|uniref:Uncharacterized protein n=1 Tax=Winogradskya consettensis TaxID=113560 RepID=A0A919SJ57_9ACTN|nr:hypothetical protein [Actinoplanes consettensis]GIM73372.1 hypothetical protein Aco04nite_34920 [Actinoplanes consettensis]